jgi:hypothetical protein
MSRAIVRLIGGELQKKLDGKQTCTSSALRELYDYRTSGTSAVEWWNYAIPLVSSLLLSLASKSTVNLYCQVTAGDVIGP